MFWVFYIIYLLSGLWLAWFARVHYDTTHPKLGFIRTWHALILLLFIFAGGVTATVHLVTSIVTIGSGILYLSLYVLPEFGWSFALCILLVRKLIPDQDYRDNVTPFYGPAEILAARRDYADAVREYQQYLARNPDDPEPHRRIANIYIEEERYAEAVAEFRSYLNKARDPENAYTVLFELLDVLERQGAEESVLRAEIRAVTGRFPDAPQQQYADARLAALGGPPGDPAAT